jgi:uncharacterized protein YjbI with pentapeptide repeats
MRLESFSLSSQQISEILESTLNSRKSSVKYTLPQRVANFIFKGPDAELVRKLAKRLPAHQLATGEIAAPPAKCFRFRGCVIRVQPTSNESIMLTLMRHDSDPHQVHHHIDAERLELTARALSIRKKLQLPQVAALLTPEGKIDLIGIDLRHKAIPKNFDLHGTDLSGANLSGANLNGANLIGANLSGARLEGTILTKANLHKASLVSAFLYRAILIGARLTYAGLSGANFSCADLTDADLRYSNVISAQLNEANMSGVVINTKTLRNLDFTGVNFGIVSPIIKELLKPAPKSWYSDLHYTHNDLGSLLIKINSINDKFPHIKISLIRQLKVNLEYNGITSDKLVTIIKLLSNNLSGAPYDKDPVITLWLSEVARHWLFSSAQATFDPEVLGGLTGILLIFYREHPREKLLNNGSFIALIDAVMRGNNDEHMATAAILYEQYLSMPEIEPWTLFPVDGICTPVEGVDLRDGDAPLIMIAVPLSLPVMVVSRDNFISMLRGSIAGWQNYFLYRAPEPESCITGSQLPPPGELFSNHFPIFERPYLNALKTARFPRLLDTLMPGEQEMKAQFLDATLSKYPNVRLTGTKQQVRLARILSQALIPPSEKDGCWCALTSSHALAIIRAYDLEDVRSLVKAQTFLGLAAVFTRYSASGVFGDEYESPEVLRRYAYALMGEAVNHNATVVNSETLQDWRNRLSGQQGAFTCSALLADMMADHANKDFPEIFKNLMPPAWR